jgi:hypothetical protein
MAKPLVVAFGGADLAFDLERVDRSRLYGTVDVEALDEKGRTCDLATLADDGRTVIGRGGTALGMISSEGMWLEKSQLKPVDAEGKPITPVPSTFGAPVPLGKKATIDEYLSHNIRSVYLVRPQGDASALVKELQAGAIFTFPYSFRGGLEADVAFLLGGKEGNLFLAVGHPTRIRFVGLEQAAALTEEGPEDEEEEALDFGMM